MSQDGNELTLDVLHINDIHSYFEETNADSARCRDPSPQCYGGNNHHYLTNKYLIVLTNTFGKMHTSS